MKRRASVTIDVTRIIDRAVEELTALEPHSRDGIPDELGLARAERDTPDPVDRAALRRVRRRRRK